MSILWSIFLLWLCFVAHLAAYMNITLAAWQCAVINTILSTTAFKPGVFKMQLFVVAIGFHMPDKKLKYWNEAFLILYSMLFSGTKVFY